LGITGSRLAKTGFSPPKGEDEDDLHGHDDEMDIDPDDDGDVDLPRAGTDLDPDQDADELHGMDDPSMLALLGDKDTEKDDDGDMDDEDEFSFDPADLGDDAHEVPDHGKTADLSNLIGGMSVSPDEEASDMGEGDDEGGADISSLFGGSDDKDQASEDESDDENIDDELDQDMDDNDESDMKFMNKGLGNMKKEAREFHAFLKKKGKGEDKANKKMPSWLKDKDKKKHEKNCKDKSRKPFELSKKGGKNKEDKVDETSFFRSLTKQAAGNVRKLKEDYLIASPKREPGPGEVGYAPIVRVGQMPSVASYRSFEPKAPTS
jgi:hypothetical protein